MTINAKLPDGTVLQFPKGTSDSVIDATVKSQLNIAPTEDSTLRGIGLGFREPFDIAAARLESLAKSQAPSVYEKIQNLGNTLGLPSASEVLSETDKLRAQNTAKLGQLAGGAGGVAALMPIRAVAAPATLLEAAVGGGLTGAALSRAKDQPQFLSDVAASSIFGTALKPVSDVISGTIAPKASYALKTLVANNVYPTLGMILGEKQGVLPYLVSKAEEGITSLPGVGDVITLARNKSISELGKAAVNRAASYIKEKVPENLSGEQAVSWVKDKLSSGYDELVPHLKFELKSDFLDEAKKIYDSLNIPSSRNDLVNDWVSLLKDNVFKVMDENGKIEGKNLQDVLSSLGDLSKTYMSSSDPFTRRIGTGAAKLRTAWFDALANQNKAQAQSLKNLNSGYSIVSQLQKATGSASGELTPASLDRAVKAFGGGNRRGPLVDLARAGRMIPSKTADSGTARRAFIGTAVTGGLVGVGNEIAQRYGLDGITPQEASAIALIAAPYTPAGRMAIARILGRTPGPLATALGQATRMALSPATSSSTIKMR